MNKINEALIHRYTQLYLLSFILLSSFTFSCGSTKQDFSKNDLIGIPSSTLIKSAHARYSDNSVSNRIKALQELERRKDIDILLDSYIYFYKSLSFVSYNRQDNYEVFIAYINILGNLGDPRAIEPLSNNLFLATKEIKLATLKAFKKIGSPKAVFPTKSLLNDPDRSIRFEALDTLANIKSRESLEAIYPTLLDKDLQYKALYALKEIGDPAAIDHISLLLADKNETIKNFAENILKEMGVSDEQISTWKRSASKLSLDDLYRTELKYQRAIAEKQILEEKLRNETDVKRQLEQSLEDRESALKRNEQLVASLYENERQLKSKLAQLDLTQQQSEEYQKELQQLNAKTKSLNVELKKAKTQTATASVREELNKTLEEKSKIEAEAKNSQEKESMLHEEIAALNALAEKTRLEAEEAKQEVVVLRNREKQLAAQVDELKQRLDRGMAPVLVVSKPINGSKIESPNTLLHFIAVDDKGISKIDVSLNGTPVKIDHQRGLKIVATEDKVSKKIDIAEKLQLQYGQNVIKIAATDTDGKSQEEVIQITRVKARGYIWAIVIGINQYQNTRSLKYAVNDAQAFKDYLKDYVGIPDDRIFYLANQEATKSRIESLLGTTIKREASKDDTVIIFYAGHGAVEPDPSNLDGDGFEKYLLPHDANLEDLYSTSISMNNIRTIFMRIRAERLIFIADTCYSGASGGRTMMATKTRANLSDKFYERISKGKGRVIISSCSANEISKEDDKLQHGVFSYYMLEGLKGRADQDGDGIITVSELFSYISRKVPQASAQDQHPVKKGETEGELVIGRTK